MGNMGWLRVLADSQSLHTATTLPPWAGSNRAAQVSSATDDVAGQSQLADDRVSPARAGVDGLAATAFARRKLALQSLADLMDPTGPMV